MDPNLARMLTDQQSESVSTYLKDNGAVAKDYWLFARKMTTLGMGVNPSPVPENPPLSVPRVEVLVFVPQK
jgi:hypothetical protein